MWGSEQFMCHCLPPSDSSGQKGNETFPDFLPSVRTQGLPNANLCGNRCFQKRVRLTRHSSSLLVHTEMANREKAGLWSGWRAQQGVVLTAKRASHNALSPAPSPVIPLLVHLFITCLSISPLTPPPFHLLSTYPSACGSSLVC